MSSLISYSAKNVELLRNKQGFFVPNMAKENFDHVLGRGGEIRDTKTLNLSRNIV